MRHWLWMAWLLTAPVQAESELRAVLDTFAEGLEGYRAEFSQEVFDASGRELESSTGTMALMAPNRFRWHYLAPYEQLIVADGDRVWIHDVDLEQVSVRQQDQAASTSPLTVLTDPGSLEQRFRLEDHGQVPAGRLIGLLPLNEDGDFEWIELIIDDRLILGLTIQDRFGQQTRIRFQRPQRNPPLDAEAFHFEPPPGVDVLSDSELLPVDAPPED